MRLLPNYPECLICGSIHPTSLKAQFYRDGDKVIATCTPRKCHAGYAGIIHGGLQGSLLDEALGRIVTSITHKLVFTGTLETRYKKPLPVDTNIIIEAWMNPEHRHPALYWEASGEIWNAEKTILYTTAKGKFFKIPDDQFHNIFSTFALEGCPNGVTMDNL